MQTGNCLPTLHGHENKVRSIAFSPEDQFLARGSKAIPPRRYLGSFGFCAI